MNNTIIIPFSKKKMVKLTGIYILIMLGIAAIIFFIISAGQKDNCNHDCAYRRDLGSRS